MSLAVVKPYADTNSNAIYGLDIGLNTRGDLNQIDLNTIPRIGIFREMRLHDMYRRARQLFLMNKKDARQEYLRSLPRIGEEQDLAGEAATATMEQEQEFEETAAEATVTVEGSEPVENTVGGEEEKLVK